MLKYHCRCSKYDFVLQQVKLCIAFKHYKHTLNRATIGLWAADAGEEIPQLCVSPLTLAATIFVILTGDYPQI